MTGCYHALSLLIPVLVSSFFDVSFSSFYVLLGFFVVICFTYFVSSDG